MLTSDSQIELFHIGKPVRIGLFENGKVLARAIGTLYSYTYVAGEHRVWFAPTVETDLQWTDSQVDSVVVTWDPEAPR